MTHDSPNSTPPPIACTLSQGDLRERFASITALARESLLSHHYEGLAIRLRYKLAAAGAVKEMVRKEQQCCPFLTFQIAESATELELTITAPEAARPFAATLFDQFIAAS